MRNSRSSTIVIGALVLWACSQKTGGHDASAPLAAGAPATGGMLAISGAGTTGGAAASGGMVSSGGANATGGAPSAGGASGASATGGMGGTTAAGGATSESGAGGAGGTNAGGSEPSDSGTGGAAGGQSGAGGTSATGGTSGGNVGKACHSTEEWTPKPDDLWIAPSGNDSNAGTEESPKKNLTAAISAWSSGKTIWVKPGTYAHNAAISLSTKATSAGPLRISGVSDGAKPVFDFSSETRATNNDGVRGFQISGSFVHLRYLEIKKASDNCVYVTGSSNTLEWLSVHECQDTGVQLSSGAASNKVLNVDSFLNADPTGENADGFAPKLSIGQDNYFCGTRSYQNADDGYDCWSSGDSSPVTFEYCWAFGQPGPTATANGDGNGFKLGSPASLASGGNAPHKLINCFAFENRSTGFTANGNSSGKITCTNCGVWGNGTAWSSGTGGAVPQHTGDITSLGVTVDQAMNAPRDASGDLPDIATL